MSYKHLFLVLSLCLFGRFSLVEASWSWEVALWNSPYHSQIICASELSYTYRPQNNLWAAVFTCPGQISKTEKGIKLEGCHPRASLALLPSLNQSTQGKLALGYQPQNQRWEWEVGWETLADPLLTYCSLVQDGAKTTLHLGVIFAANERWALGAHLHYAQDSLVTYQIHRASSQGVWRTFSYTLSAQGTLQGLSFKIGF